MSNKVLIKDIYAGKPDANDEINAEGIETFIKSFIAPNNFDIKELIEGSNCFITGYKGTGKTALLFYLDDFIKRADISACSSFIFFKEDFTDTKKQEMEMLSKRIVSSIDFDKSVLLEAQDFEYIWRWLFFKRIIEDNESFNNGLFVNDNNWNSFAKTIKRILSSSSERRKFIIPPKIKFSVPYFNTATMTTIAAEIELDFHKNKSFEEYRLFTQLIDEAEMIFKQVMRTDIPYYIFVDELEAYFGEEDTFKRDLKIIRDLIFTVKRLNTIFMGFDKGKTKIICSARTEIINAINRFIVTKEINKVTSGFESPLIWDYNNTNSFEHPILIKRIEMAESSNCIEYKSDKNIYLRWFPEKIYEIDPANYILNNSWCKPRDIVRLILAAKSCLSSNNSAFVQSVFDLCQKKYSMDSLTEIKEEMRALYSPEQIDSIFNCLTGFRSMFSVQQLKERVKHFFSDSILETNAIPVLKDLFRLGVIGNYSVISKSYRWQHKGDDGLIISDEWKIMIHRALWSALSVSNKHDRGIDRYKYISPQKNDVVEVIVKNIVEGFLLVDFEYNSKILRGSIHISQLSSKFIEDIYSFASLGDKFNAQIIGYNEIHKKWELTLKI